MGKEKFIEVLKEALEKRLEVQIITEKVCKNNGRILTGMMFKEPGLNAHVTLYVENIYETYQSGEDFESIIEKVCKVYEDNRITQEIDFSTFTNFETAKENIVCRVVNYDMNKESLQKMPHRRFLDLAVTYYYIVTDVHLCGNSYIQIKNVHMKTWGVTEEMLYDISMSNAQRLLPVEIKTIEENMKYLASKSIEVSEKIGEEPLGVLMQLFLEELEKSKDKIPMYVVTNMSKLLGAVTMLYPGVIKQFAEENDSDIYILPSSVHETIWVPVDKTVRYDTLAPIVKEINEGQVALEERLSDNVYIYRRKEDKIEML